MPLKNPPHPGDFIRSEIIQPAGLSVTAAAAALRVSRPALSSLLNGKADLSGEMALRVEKAFGVKMDTLMRMQSAYDIAQTRKRENKSGCGGYILPFMHEDLFRGRVEVVVGGVGASHFDVLLRGIAIGCRRRQASSSINPLDAGDPAQHPTAGMTR